ITSNGDSTFSTEDSVAITEVGLSLYKWSAHARSIMETEYGIKLYQEFPNDTAEERKGLIVSQPISIFPNPASEGVLHVRGLENLQGEISLEVRDLSGRMVFAETINGGKPDHQVIISGLKPSVYIFSISNE